MLRIVHDESKNRGAQVNEIEVINPHLIRGQVCHALFDFDGTLSLIREGWQHIMAQMMVEALQQTPSPEEETALTPLAIELIKHTTGQATIYQMLELAKAVEQRGGSPLSPGEYKQRFLQRLAQRIEQRLAELKAGLISREALMVPGALHILAALQARHVTCYLASGTDHTAVRREAGLLGLSPYFGDRIYGAQDDGRYFSKGEVIEGIKQQHNLTGPELVVLGDGVVEIREARAAGAVAVGIASNETARRGIDQQKREVLITAGADLIMPDFSQSEALIAYLFAGKLSHALSNL
jgi:phosphoglycolate phosphatase-like HAD superfamily hydrolase